MNIRLARHADIPQIITLGKQLLDLHFEFDQKYYDLEASFDRDFYNWAAEQIGFPGKFILVAEENGIITGFISGFIKYLFPWFKTKQVGHISYLVIDKSKRSKGAGKLLETEAVNWFKTKNLNYIEVYVDEVNQFGKIAWNSYGYQPFKKFLRKSIY